MAAGTGVILVYSAYRNTGPLSVLTGALTGDSARTTINAGISPSVNVVTTGGDVSGSSAVGSTRAAGIKAKTIRPEYVALINHPGLVLDKEAAASFFQVETSYGKPISLSGASRSTAEQAANYALHPERFGKPGTSLHEVGLAVDVNQLLNLEDPNLINAFTSHGWFRAGKMGHWYNKTTTIPEPWHWSYGVPG